MKIIPIILPFFLAASACLENCNFLCDSLNGASSCYTSCGCPSKIPSKVPSELKSELQSLIRTSTQCKIDEIHECTLENNSACLTEKNCGFLTDAYSLLSIVPTRLLKAVEPLSLNSAKFIEMASECDECAYYYYADEYYMCAFLNCRGEILDRSSFLREKNLAKLEDNTCMDCGGYGTSDEEFVNCVWFYCKSEIIDKKVLLKKKSEINLETETTCEDCETFVYADDYYNCIYNYCDEELAIKNELSEGLCGLCEGQEDVTCIYYQCKEEILSKMTELGKGGIKLTKCEDCKFYTGENYDICVYYYCNGENLEDVKIMETSDLGEKIVNLEGKNNGLCYLIGVLGFITALGVLKMAQKLKSKNPVSRVPVPEESQAPYTILL